MPKQIRLYSSFEPYIEGNEFQAGLCKKYRLLRNKFASVLALGKWSGYWRAVVVPQKPFVIASAWSHGI